jgi:peptidoglycan hydrolase-like protein with peptidoglycan-binding domain
MTLPVALASLAPITTAAVTKAVEGIFATTFDPAKWRALMKLGDQGTDVSEWQTILARDGFFAHPDGKFGADTVTATKAWQVAHKLTADGGVGKDTRAAINLSGPSSTAARVSGYSVAETPWRDFQAVAPLPGMIAQVPTEEVSRERALASKLALNLFLSAPGAEDRSLVRLFQEIHGLNATGAYGPGTAEVLIAFGIIPPKPRAWPSKGVTAVRARYKATLRAQARRDPQRALEWNAAAQAVS